MLFLYNRIRTPLIDYAMTVTKKYSLAALCLSALIAACGDSSDSPFL